MIKSRKHIRQVYVSIQSLWTVSLPKWYAGIAWFIQSWWPDSVFILCPTDFCLAYTCHKSKLTHHTWLKSGTWMVKVCTKAFLHRETDDCVTAFTGVLSLHHMKHLLGHMQYTPAREGHATEGWNMGLTYLLLLSAPMDWLETKLRWSLISAKLWKTLEVWLWLHPLHGYTLQQGNVICKTGAAEADSKYGASR